MPTTTLKKTLECLLDPLRDCLTKEVATRIAGLRADNEVQARLDDLAKRHRKGVLTTDEFTEYESLVAVGSLIAVLQAKARQVNS